MAIIQQTLNFWEEIEETPVLKLLRVTLEYMEDEELMRKLESRRRNGRNDYPVRYMWNLLVAHYLLGHETIASFRNELLRNPTLVRICGGEWRYDWSKLVPSLDAFYRFRMLLAKEYAEDVKRIFNRMLGKVSNLLKDLGEHLAVDSTALESGGKKVRDKEKQKRRDGRRDLDARVGKKTYQFSDGSRKEIRWFGYKLHIIVDTKYEIPVGFRVTPANESDFVNLVPLVEDLEKEQGEIVELAEYLMADRGYDSQENNKRLYEDYKIIPIIDKRRMKKDKELEPLNPDKLDTIYQDELGPLKCICPETGKVRTMVYMGFEKERNTLKFRCPAAAYGLECKGREICEGYSKTKSDFGRVVRVNIKTDMRRFTPVLYGTPKWERLYNKRSAVERVNSRLKNIFHVGKRFLKGLHHFVFDAAMSMAIMISIVYARIMAGDIKHIRSLYAPFPIAA